MPGTGDVRLPCGRGSYCGRTNCRHTALCARKGTGAAAHKEGAAAPGERQKKPLAHPADVVFLYDGSLAGLYCCVHEAVYTKQLPAEIWQDGNEEPTLFAQRLIETCPEKAEKVAASIPKKIGPRAKEMVETVFLSCCDKKELVILRFLLFAYREGRRAPWMLGHEDVQPMLAAEKHLGGEAHLLTGFIRFSDYDGVLAATISPKNFVLPFLAKHFVTRYSGENFIIFDKTHKAALIYEKRKHRIVPLEGIEFPEADETEQQYRALWKQFYNTIAIEARYNPKCRRTNMPMRYWENMLEVQDLLDDTKGKYLEYKITNKIQ